MFQNQYCNLKLTKNHIDKILLNYNIKYNTLKNEIDAKFNNMIKLFVNDIRAFLENIEEINNERKRIKEAENSQMEIAILKSKLEEKVLNENKMKNEIDILTKENSSLKSKIKIQLTTSKSKNEKEFNNNSILKTESRVTKNKYMRFTVGDGIKNKNILSKIRIKTEGNKNRKKFNGKKNIYLSSSMEKKSLKEVENLKYSSIQTRKKNYNSMEKRNNKIKKKNKNNVVQRTPQNKNIILYSTGNVSTNNLNKKKDNYNNTMENFHKINSEIHPFEPSLGEDDSLITDVIEEEIKELEMDEENILLLIEEINDLKKEREEKPN